eukprot:m.910740 g.910740  ORF g.910740 m.910740 type:complete len:104 (-) comp60112_c0_seq25:1246-1557(-)
MRPRLASRHMLREHSATHSLFNADSSSSRRISSIADNAASSDRSSQSPTAREPHLRPAVQENEENSNSETARETFPPASERKSETLHPSAEQMQVKVAGIIRP